VWPVLVSATIQGSRPTDGLDGSQTTRYHYAIVIGVSANLVLRKATGLRTQRLR